MKEGKQTATQEKTSELKGTKEPLKILFAWKAPDRAFKARDRQYFTTIFIIIFVLSIILLFIREFLLIGVILSLTFVYYVLSTVEPEEIEHKITNKGVVFSGTMYPWDSLISFFYTKKYSSEILNIVTVSKLPGRLFLLINPKDKETITKILSKYIEESETPQESITEKIMGKASEKLSLE